MEIKLIKSEEDYGGDITLVIGKRKYELSYLDLLELKNKIDNFVEHLTEETQEILNDKEAMKSINAHKILLGDYSDYISVDKLQDTSSKGCGKKYNDGQNTILSNRLCNGMIGNTCPECQERHKNVEVKR